MLSNSKILIWLMATFNLASADLIDDELDATGIPLFVYGSGTNGAPVFNANGTFQRYSLML